MTLAELSDVLVSTGIPTTYHSWHDVDGERPSLPFITYQVAYSNNFDADNRVYFPVQHVDISLYTAIKAPETEGTLEAALDAAELPWEKTETFLDSEHCFQIIYEVEV